VLFPGLSSLLIEGVDDAETVLRVRVRATTPEVRCPRCGSTSRRVHAWHVRQLTDIPVTGRRLVIELRVRRLVCQAGACEQRTFRDQVPELALRCPSHTRPDRDDRPGDDHAGRSSRRRDADRSGCAISRSTMLRVLMALPISLAPTPQVLGVDDVAVRHGVLAIVLLGQIYSVNGGQYM
jgi:transposase